MHLYKVHWSDSAGTDFGDEVVGGWVVDDSVEVRFAYSRPYGPDDKNTAVYVDRNDNYYLELSPIGTSFYREFLRSGTFEKYEEWKVGEKYFKLGKRYHKPITPSTNLGYL